jgi:protein phosphatase 1 regulatory subunit 21
LQLGQVISPIPLLEIEARETKVKSYFTGRINQLVADRQLAEGKASSFKAEVQLIFEYKSLLILFYCFSQCMSLHERLQLAVEQKSLTEQQMSVSGQSLEKLQGELLTTTTNYETQLSMMSEHLANMNEKLTVQKDEIDQLNYQLKSKGKK